MSESSKLSAFLGHSNSDKKTSAYFRGWRKDGEALVLLHQQCGIEPVWQHSLPRIQTFEKDGVEEKHVWSGSWNCVEPEPILKKQFHRSRDNLDRIVPPTICPLCIMAEYLRTRVNEGSLGIADPLFRWTSDDNPDENKTITVGGFFNAFSRNNLKHLSASQIAEMKKARIKTKNAWKQNTTAKCQYLFVVANVNSPEDGVLIALENTSLGAKMRKCIEDRMDSEGMPEGDPLANPVVFRWRYDENESEPNKKYTVAALNKELSELDDDVREDLLKLIASDAPNVDHIIGPGHVKKLKADLLEHCVRDDIDWEYIFEAAWDKYVTNDESADSEDDDDSDDDDSEDEFDKKPKTPEIYECDVCDVPGLTDDSLECEHCGATYDDDGEVVTHPGYDYDEDSETYSKKPARRKRTKKKAAKKKAAKKPEPEDDEPDPEPAAKATKRKTGKKKAAKKGSSKGRAKKGGAMASEDIDKLLEGDDLPFSE